MGCVCQSRQQHQNICCQLPQRGEAMRGATPEQQREQLAWKVGRGQHGSSRSKGDNDNNQHRMVLARDKRRKWGGNGQIPPQSRMLLCSVEVCSAVFGPLPPPRHHGSAHSPCQGGKPITVVFENKSGIQQKLLPHCQELIQHS